MALLLLFTLDSVYYHRPVLTPLSFLVTNASPISLFYGSSPWHYYLTQGLPLLCGPALPFAAHGSWRALHTGTPAERTMLFVVAWTTVAYSLAGHKEWRFLHPLLPLLHALAAKSLVDLATPPPRAAGPVPRIFSLPVRRSHFALLFLLSVLPAAYVIRWHAHAQISVLHFLRGVPTHELHSVGFLMPCHSTPGQSHLHRALPPGHLWALGCEPPLG